MADLTHYYLSYELLCVEIGLRDNGENDNKIMNEREIKTPKMLKDFLWWTTSEKDALKHDIITTGFIISGFRISSVTLSCPKGSVCLVNKSRCFPESLDEFVGCLSDIIIMVYRNFELVMDDITAIKSYSQAIRFDYDDQALQVLPPCYNTNNTDDSPDPKRQKLT